MGNINRVPLGLLSLLDTQAQGQAPANLLDSVQSGLDLTGLWFNSKGQEQISDAGTIQLVSGQSANASQTVPEGELWAVVCASARVYATDAAPTAHTVQVTYLPRPGVGANTITLAQSPGSLLTLNGVLAASVVFPSTTPFYAPAGSTFGVYMSVQAALALGSIPEISLIIYRLKI
jgi:hypothetical protein